MSIGGLVVEAVKALVPPKTNDLEEQQRWRWIVFAALIALSVAVALHIAIACGYLPSVSSGFALASEQRFIQRRVDVIATLSLEHEIRSKTAELCRERLEGRRTELNDDISKLQREYLEIEKKWYAVPGCDRL